MGFCCRTEKDGICIDILDDGPGIPENVRETVFHPFTRLDRSHSLSSGDFGLGLAIVDRIVSLHGGTISTNDNFPWGSHITTRWPDARWSTLIQTDTFYYTKRTDKSFNFYYL